MGTPHYMPPEQGMGRTVDHRADIYAFGVVLYQIFAGTLPFDGATVHEIVLKHVTEPPLPPSRHRPIYPPQMEQLILECLEKEPVKRPNSMRVVRSRIDAAFATAARSGVAATVPALTARSSLQRSDVPDARNSPHGVKTPSRGVAWAAVGISVLAVAVFGLARVRKSAAPSLNPGPARTVSDPTRRFFVYVKTDPEGANIYRADGHKLMGATPITLPVDLTGVSGVHLLIEKPGFEKYDQIVVNDDPISISLTPSPMGASSVAAPPEISKPAEATAISPKGERHASQHHRDSTTPVSPQSVGMATSGADRASAPTPTKSGPIPTQADISRVINNNRADIKKCYQHALLEDSSLTHGKITVKLVIETSGQVKNIEIQGPPQFRVLEPCIKERLDLWSFPQAGEEYGTEFVYIFQGNE